MSEEPRRSGRATKGQHKNASSSPAPSAKPAKAAPKSKPPKKSTEPEPQDEDDEEVIRCICGNSNPKDKRAFIGCDACTVWQHNVCMGIPDDEDDVPDHYFCEECRPEEHEETIQALQRGEKIWETRNKLYQNEKKMSKSRKSKGKQGEEYKPAWLKKDIAPQPPAGPEPAPEPTPAANGKKESNNKRKREEEPAAEPEAKPAPEKPAQSGRKDKRRKSSPAETTAVMDTDTALVPIKDLPKDRQSVAQALSKIITGDIQQRIKSGFKLPANQTATSLAEHYGARIEYALHMNHGNKEPSYKQQFMALNANLKKNVILIERLINGSLTADELSTMSSSDMASEELQKERAAMKEELDRQAIAIQEEGPRYKQDHKGFHEIEMESQQQPQPEPATAPRQESAQAGSPVNHQPPLAIDTSQQADSGVERRPSSQQFDMNNIWAKTANSPTGTAPRPMSTHARRPSAPAPAEQNGARDDPDIDRMLDDNDESYSPADASGSDAIVWRGKLMQANEDEVTVNARFVAGRDLSGTLAWQSLLPERLSIDGRLAINKAEEYLCGLPWSSSSDVSVLALTPYDTIEPFNHIFEYFHSRERYAVVEKSKPRIAKDFYIIPVEVGSELPAHIKMLEECNIKTPVEERMLLATIVASRSPEEPPIAADSTPSQHPANGHLPPHMRQSIGGPAGSPINTQHAAFSPSGHTPPQAGYGAPNPNGLPPNPYTAPPVQQPPPPQQQQYPPPQPNHLVNEILGELQYCPSAQVILGQAPDLDRDRLQNLKKILMEDENAKTDFNALVKKLYSA